ncbi:ATP-binding protein [Massilia sp. erpn]|uniref:ATP-binding protein n=1 Tax=Massilia sp. erpn TaxID=2738142 RepID=UPI002106AD46|nr:ATP-binding protein [Massilia sp. erpn]UTY55879.1 hypothetical protein HPQ68_00960 [Massilia sp. erpn]
MTLVCLIGRHGSGKSTIGTQLAAQGYRHISAGLLRRLAQSRQYPSDVPAGLISAMGRERPGALLSLATARRLVAHACTSPLTVLDGFPAAPEQIALLPPDTLFCLVWAPAALRGHRLASRAATTQRQWQPGRASGREAALAHLIAHLRCMRRCLFVRNAGAAGMTAADLLAKIART